MTTTTPTPSTRQYRGTAVPEPGTYDLDQAHTTVEFVARHLMITKVRGRFARFSGEITVAEVPEESSVSVTIDAESVDTNQDQRDTHLRSADFLDAEHYPTLVFASTGVALDGDAWKVTGDLTIHGVTRPVTLDVEFDGANITPWGTQAIAFSASTEIDREDFGLTYNQALETGGVVVSKKIRIELSVEAVLRQEQAGEVA
ncbi:MAG TPA: YceI family protein [Acidimicrobiales bacterium]|nr:YceI family protein [Acidimicrobiales bacterium]